MTANDLLNNHSLKRTSCREGIIEIMQNSRTALSETEIRENLTGNYDRTTFYRSFKTLEEHKIIHKIVIDNQIIKYAINKPSCQNKKHLHFYCNKCHTVQCIDAISSLDVKMPDDYVTEEIDVLIKGICATCK